MRTWEVNMAYLHCHTKGCNWSQDDFWHKGYNPIKFLYENYEKDLLSDELDNVVGMDSYWLEENGIEFITKRGLIIMRLKKMIRNIESMKYPREKDWKAHKEDSCPKCLKRDWDID